MKADQQKELQLEVRHIADLIIRLERQREDQQDVLMNLTEEGGGDTEIESKLESIIYAYDNAIEAADNLLDKIERLLPADE